MKYEESAKKIYEALGREENIISVLHCITRLRINLADESIVNDEEIKAIPGVMGIMKQAGQYQIIMGNEVPKYYHKLIKLGKFETKDTINEESQEKNNLFSRIIATISAAMSPLIPALLGGGMIKVLLLFINLFGWMSPESTSYQLLSIFGDAPFYFIPIMIAYSLSPKFNVTPALGAVVAGIMLHPNFSNMVSAGNPISFFGINVPLVSYASTVVPMLIMIWLMGYLERFVNKIVPDFLQSFLRPMLVILISAPIALTVAGPLGNWVGEGLASIMLGLQNHVPWLAVGLMAFFMPVIVMTGMHWAFAPIFLAASIESPDSLILPTMYVANIAQGVAALAVSIKARNSHTKQVGFAAAVSAIVAGVTEPAIYGVNLKYRKPFYAAMIGGGIAGIYMGLNRVQAYVFASPSLLTTPQFYLEGQPATLTHTLISAAISIVITFLLTWAMWKEEEDIKDYNKGDSGQHLESGSYDSNQITSPLTGQLIPLEAVADQVFSSKVMGEGVAIIPKEAAVLAPFDGEVVALMETKHAVGLKSERGIELLIHIGIDTVELEGKGFESFVNIGDKVVRGQKLIQADINYLRERGYDTTTPIVVTNTAEFVDVIPAKEVEDADFDTTILVVI